MIPWKTIAELRNQASTFKELGDFSSMLPLCEKVVELYVEHGAEAKRVASGWNYVAYVNRQLKDFAAAERAARRSLSHYVENITEKDESLATYLAMLASTLQDQERFADALPYMEEAVGLFAAFHGESDWVLARRAELEEIRQQVWRG
jgi:tetratricopeptide (TPR) repeat protein